MKIKELSWFVKIVTLIKSSLCRHREDIAALEDASEKPDFARLGRARGKSEVLARLAASDNRLPLNLKIGCDISAEGRTAEEAGIEKCSSGNACFRIS